MAFSMQALEYVKNTAGNATVKHFEEDFEPIGGLMWSDLVESNLAFEGEDGYVRLTDAGRKMLQGLPQ